MAAKKNHKSIGDSKKPSVCCFPRLPFSQIDLDEAVGTARSVLVGSDKTRLEFARRAITRATQDSKNPASPGLAIGFGAACTLAGSTLEGYATLDETLIREIESFVSSLQAYIDDRSAKRPHGTLLMASPGSGKSHFVACIANRLRESNVSFIPLNMASMSRNTDLVRPLDEARNVKADNGVPLIFFDEIDSAPGNFSLLLPLLWDGVLTVEGRDLRLNKGIVVMSGSGRALSQALERAQDMQEDLPLPPNSPPKFADFLSRIGGGILRIPKVSGDPSRIVDKVVIAAHLMRRKFPKLLLAPLSLFRFVAKATLRFDVRSLGQLVELIPYAEDTTVLSREALGLPFGSADELRNSSIVYHLIDDENQAQGLVDLWFEASTNDSLVPVHLECSGRSRERFLELSVMKTLKFMDGSISPDGTF